MDECCSREPRRFVVGHRLCYTSRTRADLEQEDEQDHTPLLWTAKRGRGSVMKLLLDIQADVEARDSQWKQTPLSCAAKRGQEGVVKILVQYKANLEATDFGNLHLKS